MLYGINKWFDMIGKAYAKLWKKCLVEKRKMSNLKSQRSLRAWTKQKWRTKSGKKSSETGERYLPEKAIKALSAAEYAATTKKEKKTQLKVNSILNNRKK